MECTLVILPPPSLNVDSNIKHNQIPDIVRRAINQELSIDSTDRTITFDTYKQGKCEKHIVECVSEAKIMAQIKFNQSLKLSVESLITRLTKDNIFRGRIDYWLYMEPTLILGRPRSLIDAKISNTLKASELALGSVVGLNRFAQHYTTNSERFSCKGCVFEHDDKITVTFTISKQLKMGKITSYSKEDFEMVIGYNTIKRLVISKVTVKEHNQMVDGYDLYIFVNKPVKIYTLYNPKEDEFTSTNKTEESDDDYNEMHNSEYRKQWIRTVKFGSCEPEVMAKSPVVKIRLSSVNKEVWETLKQMTICLEEEIEVFFANVETILREANVNGISNSCLKGNFNCYFALQCVLSNTYQLSDEVFFKKNGPELSRKLKEWSVKNPRALEQSLFELHRLLEIHQIQAAEVALIDLYEKYKEGTLKEPQLPPEMIELRRAVLTPLGLSFKSTLPYLKSTLLRNCDPSYGIRVSIEDVCGSTLSQTLSGKMRHRAKLIEKCIRPFLENGFKIGPRQYEFFGCSPSQMREHGCFFYAKDTEGRTAATLRSIIGSLDNIKTVPKYLARMGQSLSQSMARVIIKKTKTEVVPDIIRGGYIFSDGVGRMSREIALKIYQALYLEPDDQPSAFQIRYGGCKGMLVIDPTLKGEKIIFRESMAKFDSPLESLEIIKVSRPLWVYLNKSFIMILEHLGIKDKVFLSLQTQRLRDLTASLVESEKAADLLRAEAAIRLPYTLLHKAGFDLANEPYFKPVVMALYRRAISELRSKARIRIPFGKGRTMFGVLDETGKLKPEEVFVQYSEVVDDNTGVTKKTRIRTGDILVTKNPCMHEGDVRKFEAVDIPDLHHIVDCIVFPQNGDRPLPDQMAGSDLDGDEYCVIWLEELLFEGPNREPMDYTNNAKVQQTDNITVSDMCDFMCKYLLQSGVGLFANAHVVWADRNGLQSPECYSLSKKYSEALDFAKTGTTPSITKREQVRMYPDFMEKHSHKTSYLSTRALGYLYRNCKRIELASEALSDTVLIKEDPSLVVDGWEEYKDQAEKALEKYRNLLLVPARIFSLSKESEVAAGVIEVSSDPRKKRQESDNAEKALNCLLKHSVEIMKEFFYQEFVSKDLPTWKRVSKVAEHRFIEACLGRQLEDERLPLLDKMLKKAIAWYKVAYDAPENDARKLILGLPWVVSELIGIVKIRNRNINGISSSFLSTKMNTFVNSIFPIPCENADQYTQANKILQHWINSNKGFLKLREIVQVQSCYVVAKAELDRLLRNETSLVKKSAAQQVLSCLKELSLYCCLTPDADNDNSPEYWRIIRELGLLAFITVSNLASSGGLWQDEQGSEPIIPKWKEVRESIVLVISDMFKKFFLQNENSIIEVLINRTKVSSIDLEYENYTCGPKEHIRVKLSVDGKKWNIQMLKDLVVQSNFRTIIRDDVRASQ